jgi:hypothetical protein
MKDGRSRPPGPPLFVQTELVTRVVNQTLGTNYRPDEIEDMPEMWLLKIQLLADALNNGTNS